MPTLPLYTPNDVADASHRVTAPGGYEWWYFDAESATGPGDVRLVAILLDGFVFHPEYLRRYARYRRNPTRHLPPLPSEYPCAYFAVYERDRLLAQFMTQYPLEQFAASPHRPSVTAGPNEFSCEPDGSLSLRMRGVPWELTWRGPQRDPGRLLSAHLTFRPRLPHPPHERTFLSRRLASGEHHWVIANPLCDVAGTIVLSPGGGGRAAREIDFRGRGYHDHNYGTGPIGEGLRRWTWGRILFDDRVLTFHLAQPRDRRLPREVHLIEADAAGLHELPVGDVSGDWSGRSGTLLHYPRALRFQIAGGTGLTLTDPHVVDGSPFYLRISYAAALGARKGRAFCEVAYPHRLRWPVLGRMIEMSIQRAGNGEG